MTKRHCGIISVRYLAEATAERQGRGTTTDRAAVCRPRPQRAPTPRRQFHDHARGWRPLLPSYLPVPHNLLRGDVPRDRPRGLCLRRATSRPSGVARPRVRRRASSSPLPPRPRVGDVVHGGSAALSAEAYLSRPSTQSRPRRAILPPPLLPLRCCPRQRLPGRSLSARPSPVKGGVASGGSRADSRPAARVPPLAPSPPP